LGHTIFPGKAWKELQSNSFKERHPMDLSLNFPSELSVLWWYLRMGLLFEGLVNLRLAQFIGRNRTEGEVQVVTGTRF